MPSLPLFDPTAHPDGWHDVRAPGGYEWWYFDAEDAATDTQIVVILMQGFIFDPGYLRAYERFMRRPTKHAPPTAADFPSVYACVYRNGAIWKQFFTRYRSDDVEVSRNGADVCIGPNRLTTDASGSYQLDVAGSPWRLTGRGPVTELDQSMRVRMSFQPTHRITPIERAFLSREMTGADHRWTIAAPRCEVNATVCLEHLQNPLPRTRGRGQGEGESARGSTSNTLRSSSDPLTPTLSPEYGGEGVASSHHGETHLQLIGLGYHDHNFGTAPIRQGLKRWIWGRAMFGERVLTFHHAEPSDSSRVAETHLVEVDGGVARGIAAANVRAEGSLASRPAMMLKYPSTIRFGDELLLSNPRVIDPSPFYLRLVYDAVSRGESSRAFCEIAYPRRLEWPLLGRLIEMSFDTRPLQR